VNGSSPLDEHHAQDGDHPGRSLGQVNGPGLNSTLSSISQTQTKRHSPARSPQNGSVPWILAGHRSHCASSAAAINRRTARSAGAGSTPGCHRAAPAHPPAHAAVHAPASASPPVPPNATKNTTTNARLSQRQLSAISATNPFAATFRAFRVLSRFSRSKRPPTGCRIVIAPRSPARRPVDGRAGLDRSQGHTQQPGDLLARAGPVIDDNLCLATFLALGQAWCPYLVPSHFRALRQLFRLFPRPAVHHLDADRLSASSATVSNGA